MSRIQTPDLFDLTLYESVQAWPTDSRVELTPFDGVSSLEDDGPDVLVPAHLIEEVFGDATTPDEILLERPLSSAVRRRVGTGNAGIPPVLRTIVLDEIANGGDKLPARNIVTFNLPETPDEWIPCRVEALGDGTNQSRGIVVLHDEEGRKRAGLEPASGWIHRKTGEIIFLGREWNDEDEI